MLTPPPTEEEEVDKMMEQKMKEEQERRRKKEMEERMSLEETREQVTLLSSAQRTQASGLGLENSGIWDPRSPSTTTKPRHVRSS